jgi:ubiquinone/menaquinone biosynthesis C-methylase UbiE
MLAICRQKGTSLLITADAEYLPIQNSTFDLVTCMGVFEYYPLEISDKILQEFARVVKPSGRVVIDFPNSQAEDSYKLISGYYIIYEKEKIVKTIEKYFTIAKENFVSNEIQFLLYPKNKK